MVSDWRVAFQGEAGAHSEEAVRSRFGEGEHLGLPSLSRVFTAVASGEVDAAVVPVENAYAGSVYETFDRMLEYSVLIRGELYQPIHHALMVPSGTSRAEIRRVLSHPQALAQCDHFLRSHSYEPVSFYDTAGAAREVARAHRPGEAALAAVRAAEIYGLEILERDVEDAHDNTTRFWLITRADAAAPDVAGLGTAPAAATSTTVDSPPDSLSAAAAEQPPYKTTLTFGTENEPGALYRALGCFARAGINLLKLESRPSHQHPWEASFFADCLGDPARPPLDTVLEELRGLTTQLRLLGVYPAARLTL